MNFKGDLYEISANAINSVADTTITMSFQCYDIVNEPMQQVLDSLADLFPGGKFYFDISPLVKTQNQKHRHHQITVQLVHGKEEWDLVDSKGIIQRSNGVFFIVGTSFVDSRIIQVQSSYVQHKIYLVDEMLREYICDDRDYWTFIYNEEYLYKYVPSEGFKIIGKY